MAKWNQRGVQGPLYAHMNYGSSHHCVCNDSGAKVCEIKYDPFIIQSLVFYPYITEMLASSLIIDMLMLMIEPMVSGTRTNIKQNIFLIISCPTQLVRRCLVLRLVFRVILMVATLKARFSELSGV